MIEILTNPVLLIAVPLFFILLSLFASFLIPKVIKYLSPVCFSINLLVLSCKIRAILSGKIIVSSVYFFQSSFGLNLALDRSSVLIAFIVAAIAMLVSVYNFFYVSGNLSERFHMLFITLGFSIIWVVLARDLLNLFVAFELVFVSSFVLINLDKSKKFIKTRSLYLKVGSVAGVLILAGIILLYVITGTLDIAQVAKNIDSLSLFQKAIPFVLIFTGLAAQGAIFPLNLWFPGAIFSAPFPVSSMLSGVAAIASIFAIARIVFTMLNFQGVLPLIVFLGVVTTVLGEASALYQKDIKRMLAFSTIGHTGILLMVMFFGSPQSFSGSVLLILNYSVSKTILFLSAGNLSANTGSSDIDSFIGLGYRMRISSTIFTIAALSIIGIPPFFGFFSKFYTLLSLVYRINSVSIMIAILLLLASIVEAICLFRVIKTLFTKTPAIGNCENYSLVVPVIILFVILLALSVFPNLVFSFARQSAADFFNRALYIGSVLGGM